MRLSTMNSQTMPEHLFAQVVTDVQAVETTASGAGLRTGRDYLVSLHPLHVY